MTVPRAFILGNLVVLGLWCTMVYARGPAMWLLAAPPAALAGAAVFGDGTAGWLRRVVRGAVGGALAGGVAFAAMLWLKGRTDWYDWPADSAGELYLAFLLSLAMIPGHAAAATARPACGLALATGFATGFAALLSRGEALDPGTTVVLTIGVVVGAVVRATAALMDVLAARRSGPHRGG